MHIEIYLTNNCQHKYFLIQNFNRYMYIFAALFHKSFLNNDLVMSSFACNGLCVRVIKENGTSSSHLQEGGNIRVFFKAGVDLKTCHLVDN